jgi:hypothetical protein
MIFILGSARGSRAGDGVLAIANFLFRMDVMWYSEDFGEAAETSTRAACAPQNEQSLRVLSLCNLSNDDVAGRLKRKLNFSNFRFGVSAVAV